MEPEEGSQEAVVTQLDDLGPARLAALLCATRNQRMQSRREVARRIGTSVTALRRWERGDAPIPREMLVALAVYYGEDLTARFGIRAPAAAESHPIVARTEAVQLGSAEAVATAASEPSELAVETLLADLALARLGTVLRSTREETSDSRRNVASQVGTTARELRRYETGATPVPRGILTALAEFYGEDLDTRFAHRNPTPPDRWRVMGGVEEAQVHSGDGDEALGAYVGMLRRSPDTAPDVPLTLRAEDVEALSIALAVEPEHLEGRIAELLAGTTRLRRHNQLRRRKRIVSGAAIGVVAATLAGFGIGALATALPSHADPLTSPVVATSTTVATTSTTVATTSTSVAEPSTTIVEPSTSIAEPPTVPVTTPVPTEPSTTTTTSVAIGAPITVVASTTTTTTTLPPPHISTDTTPVSIPGTEPVTVITP
jgi:transcriptional regulator with XRE-family HTH domain